MATASTWQRPPDGVVVRPGEVHVWRARLSVGVSRVSELAGSLSPDELARAGAFRSAQDRARFVVAHGVLRAVLGRCLCVEPVGLRFESGRYGKPRLAADSADGLTFNMSHSRELGLFAVARGREVGVDVEKVRPLACHQIAERFFSPAEAAALRDLPADRRLEAFFRGWTRKEASLKAAGQGRLVPLGRPEVAAPPKEAVAPHGVAREGEERQRWSVRDLRPGRGYVGALAAEGEGWALRCWQWTERAR